MTLSRWQRVWRALHGADPYGDGYATGYKTGLDAGHDMGKRVAHNITLQEQLPGILDRYGKLLLNKVIGSKKTAKEMTALYERFLAEELERLKMELQDR